VDDRTWSQTFTSRLVAESDLPTVLAAAGLVLDRYLDDDRSWVVARPDPAG
jgi:hypothetical protein